MSSFKTNIRAHNLLLDLPPELYKLYACLRSVMDYKTGISGITHRMDDSFFTQRLGYSARKGRKGCYIDMRQVERWIDQLEDEGLIKRYSNYVFKLLLEDVNPEYEAKEILNPRENSEGQKRSKRGDGKVTERLRKGDGIYPQDKLLITKEEQGDFKRGDGKVTERLQEGCHHLRMYQDIQEYDNYINQDNPLDIQTSLPLDTLSVFSKNEKRTTKREKYSCEDFKKFWAAYPSPGKKFKAWQTWVKCKLHLEVERIVDDIGWRKQNDTQWRDGYIPMASTYLNQRRWEDDRRKQENLELDDYETFMAKRMAKKAQEGK